MKPIEPSEILTGKESNQPKSPALTPWIRCLARFFDYALLCLVLLFFKGHADTTFLERLLPVEFLAWILIEALCLTFFGTTPGKSFLHLRLQFNRKKRPDFLTALSRSASVWWRGLGLGIPILNILCLLTAYQRLKLTQTTTWDREAHSFVSSHSLQRWRLITAALFSVVVLSLYFY